MPNQVVMGAVLSCSFGAAPAKLMVLPSNRYCVEGQFAANIIDHKSMVNIASFGVCTSMANPQVSAATSAAMGVLTPMPCVPMTTAPWTPGAARGQITGQPALHSKCTCLCQWAGVIKVDQPGTTRTMIA
ncbi:MULTISPECIES: DUF4280 domain-containing protein [unclassified Pseudomonas]|uniref:DUF4280 domain-containing protein n=1 Tax=unclassified Pseudomonas TaxID=196821 RepID=UPI00119980B0|nr:uncharacterized protein DUF4280 [Pseudomonas sp. SJZ075]TWC26624.1 uncharacterized protein DUF4280 [Pseudomonas sp. SJZ078]TWC45369.1 uncharacterized protein DUF4280 [Pseudomonas sp. SJZ124]TWC46139.1 uncharacterized protein DUF4280 [Pseudomonas sp. SJZ080]TWC80450.1 uncharacterized protein DUF4280 [Pseudomonas sp. SJZ101]